LEPVLELGLGEELELELAEGLVLESESALVPA
jgi:hypothetical protein